MADKKKKVEEETDEQAVEKLTQNLLHCAGLMQSHPEMFRKLRMENSRFWEALLQVFGDLDNLIDDVLNPPPTTGGPSS